MTRNQENELIGGCLEACRRCLELAESLTREQYAEPVAGRSPIGAHMRHCLEHFVCFFQGLPERRVNYDARDRNLELEKNPEAMIAGLRQTMGQLEALRGTETETGLTVLQTASEGSAPLELPSTIGRELAFLSSHSIHHLALMVVLAEFAGARAREDIGVAYSTAAHHAEQQEH